MLIRSMAAARTFKRRVEAQVCLCLCRTGLLRRACRLRQAYSDSLLVLYLYMQIIAPGEVADDFNFNTDKKVHNQEQGQCGHIHVPPNNHIYGHPILTRLSPPPKPYTHARIAKQKCSAC